MKIFLTIFLVLFSTYSLSDPLKLEHESILLNGIYSSIPYKSKSIALILHGTRGHQNLELITSLRDSLLANGVDSLTINLSYGIDNRANDFLSCDIEHRHKQSNSQHEIKLWYEHIKKIGYEKIYLIGHSRGGLDIINFYESLDSKNQDSINSVFLLAPISETWKSLSDRYKESYNINTWDLVKKKTKKLKISFLGCEDATVYRDTFLDYYFIGDNTHFFDSGVTEFAGRGLNLHLTHTSGKIRVITASEDTITPNTYKIVNDIAARRKNIELYHVDGADHFFRDFYFDDLMEIIMENTT